MEGNFGKFVFWKEFEAANLAAGEAAAIEQAKYAQEKWAGKGLNCLRIYSEVVEGHAYAFQFYAADPAIADEIFADIRANSALLEGWTAGSHCYEFPLRPGDTYENLKTQGIIIGVADGMLEEYIRLHDEQPQIIRDLCYQNGFRKSSIFVVELHKLYLLQFQDFFGEENPELYEDETYIEWLRVTGLCQAPLPGEKFWKPMKSVIEV